MQRLHIVVGRSGSSEHARTARALADRITGARVVVSPDPEARRHYYVDPSAWHGRVSEYEIALFASDTSQAGALCMDACIAESQAAARVLRALGARRVHVIEAPSDSDAHAAEVVRLFESLDGIAGLAPQPSERNPLRVFISGDASEIEHRGGPSVRMRQTADALRRLGHYVELGSVLDADRRDFDVAHVFNSWPARSSLERVEAAKGAGVPVLLSPIYMDHRETAWARRALRSGFPGAGGGLAGAVAGLRLRWTEPTRRRRLTDELREYRELVPRMLALADHAALLSHAELRGLQELGCEPVSRTFVWNTIDPTPFASADPDRFRREHGLKRYVLCVGRIEFRKNQAMLLSAMHRSEVGVALVGRCTSRRYQRQIDAHVGPNTLLVDHLEAGSPMLASAFAGAAAFVLPSWVEGAPIAALEAAAAGTPLVLGARAGVSEYFGRLAHYCEPSDPASIRDAIDEAIAEDSLEWRQRRRELVSRKLTLEASARSTVEAYRRAIEASRGTSPGT